MSTTVGVSITMNMSKDVSYNDRKYEYNHENSMNMCTNVSMSVSTNMKRTSVNVSITMNMSKSTIK